MSNVLAVAAVSQILKDLLNDALINGDASQALGSDFQVTALPPDRVVAQNGDQTPTLNLFLFQTSRNAALGNADLPTRSRDGQLLQRPRLALDLHYILTAAAQEELHAEILLGYAMQLFHETPILARESIRAALDAAVFDQILPQGFDPVRASELADQLELIKITQRALSMDDMSRMWTALQAPYRTTVAYEVSVVLIERDLPTRPTLPVLSRGGPTDPASGRDPGVRLRPDLFITTPTLASVAPLDGQPVMRMGGDVALDGFALDAGEATVRFTEPGSSNVVELAPRLPVTPNRMLVRLPEGPPLPLTDPLSMTGSDPRSWRIGPYLIDVALIAADGREMQSNALVLALAPRITAAAAADAGGIAITTTSEPGIRAGQKVAVLAGTRMAVLETPTELVDEVTAVFDDLPPGGRVPVRLRVDGVDSPVINRQTDPPSLETVALS